tara:strand:- start:883 stop:2442 length:1560 start_codon:yes stop_codon:yes gene_type:complete
MSDKPESPIADTVLSNPLNPFSKRVGRTTEIFSYRTTIDGESVFVIESVELDLNGNTGATKGISLSGNDRFKGSIDSLSKEDKELVSGALTNNSVRDEAYKKRMLEVRKKAEKNGKLEEFDAALEKNGNLEAITGNGSFSESGPETTKDRNNAKIKAEDDAEKARLEEFKKSIEVSDKDHKYPIDMKSDDGQDYVYFEQFEYLPPQNTKRSGDKETLNNEIGQTLKQGVGRGRNTKVRHGSCKLPIPNKLGVSNGVNWGEGRANAVELSAFQSADRGIQELITKGNVLKAIGGAKDQVGDALNVVRGDLSGRTERSGENISAGDVLSATLARSVLGTIGINVDVDQFITRQTGAAINPNLELLFGGPQLRSFSFNFNFAPNSSVEAKEVREIQRWFRQGMLPSRRRASQTSGSALFLASPNVFRICYKNKNRRIKGLNIIKICALTSCQIDFTPDGTYQSYDDVDGVSMPVRSTMGITFTELTPVFKDDYSPKVESPSMLDLDTNVTGPNAIDENDIGI